MAEIPELADPPVIFISGYGRDDTIAHALEAGAADCIVNPFSATELTARITPVNCLSGSDGGNKGPHLLYLRMPVFKESAGFAPRFH